MTRETAISLGSAALILALGAGLGWQGHDRITAATAARQEAVARAAAAGIAVGADGTVRPTRSSRGDRRPAGGGEAEANRVTDLLLAAAREIEALQKSRQEPDAAMQRRLAAAVAGISALDGPQIGILIDRMIGAGDINPELRGNLVGFSLKALGESRPKSALAVMERLHREHPGDDSIVPKRVVGETLATLAATDPQAALAWAKAHGADLVDDRSKRKLIAGVAANDPRAAFAMIADLAPERDAVEGILEAARTPDQRTATLAALRDHAATLTDPEARAKVLGDGTRQLLEGAVRQDFDSASAWIAANGLIDRDPGQLADRIANEGKPADSARWIGFLSEKLPTDESAKGVRRLMERWTESDYQAAGTWLAAQPAGASKNTSIQAYAETVSRYEPEAAADWAATLPAGPLRDETNRRIYRNWPKNDPGSKQAAEIFAERHGVAR